MAWKLKSSVIDEPGGWYVIFQNENYHTQAVYTAFLFILIASDITFVI